ncbi:MAG: DNA recombination protein RmuC [Candidatus Pacebacteria bacterium]|jgi:DNA recombination protein RmuC|nr:DNA recombination protein RmuC [Candidatus Paceibacterota bacterium]MBT3511862.1 DNA recombination protein RmuC [Candidatus Paceibacterota bacterium]MBT4005043.1 DNA recombination protein RmuC [Candidatus Paceibacterota bacterium]MBT4359284.1 DNA recombination protein RmuC [Candidatus Paceibacterota bacterium]MBT4680881.1 DNA recombination protein RmuC [Candidatus Paceibacterota bacterium]
MSIDLLLVLGVIIFGFITLYMLLQKKLSKNNSEQEVENLVHKVFSLSTTKIAEQSKQVLEGEKEAIKIDLENKQQVIEKLIKQLQEDLSERQRETRMIDKDRNQKFDKLTTQIDEHRKLTKELETSTSQLAKVLSNNQTRGAWGERIIEDLLLSQGLIEGVHFQRQVSLGSSNLKPDITLLLPNNRVVPVDVKFPYSEIQKMATAETKKGKNEHLLQFKRDLKIKINKVAEYISPEQNTLDYAIMFVPNEMVFSFINQKLSDVVDEALEKRVIIVSPFTFIIVARTIMESYRNFMLEDKLREVIGYIDSFTQEWSKFKDQFGKYGRSIETLKKSYDDLTGTRFKQMNRKIEKIENYHGQELEKVEVGDKVRLKS